MNAENNAAGRGLHRVNLAAVRVHPCAVRGNLFDDARVLVPLVITRARRHLEEKRRIAGWGKGAPESVVKLSASRIVKLPPHAAVVMKNGSPTGCGTLSLLQKAAISPARRADFTRHEPDFSLPEWAEFHFYYSRVNLSARDICPDSVKICSDYGEKRPIGVVKNRLSRW